MSKPPPDPVHILHEESGSVTALYSFGAKSRELLISGSQTGFITVWSLKSYRPVKSWKAHEASVLWIAVTEGACHIISMGRGESVTIWNDENQPIVRIPVSHDCFCKCDILGPLLVIPHDKNELQLFSIEEEKHELLNKISISTDEGAVFIAKFLTGADRLLAAYESGGIFIWNLPACTLASQTRVGHLPNCAAHNSERHEILIGTSSETLFIYDDRDLKLLKEISLVNPGLNAIVVRPTDRRLYATAGWDKRIRVFSAKSHKKLCVLQVHEGSINAVTYVVDTRSLLAAGGSDGLISLWDLYNDVSSNNP